MTIAAASAAAGDHVLYLDANGSASGRRIVDILEIILPDSENASELASAAASRIDIAVVTDVFEVFDVLENKRQQLAKLAPPTRGGLIILDSAPAVLSPILGGNQFQGHALMMSLAFTLKKLAHAYNCAVILTNYFTQSTSDGSSRTPALGQSWFGVPYLRLDLAQLQ